MFISNSNQIRLVVFYQAYKFRLLSLFRTILQAFEKLNYCSTIFYL